MCKGTDNNNFALSFDIGSDIDSVATLLFVSPISLTNNLDIALTQGSSGVTILFDKYVCAVMSSPHRCDSLSKTINAPAVHNNEDVMNMMAINIE